MKTCREIEESKWPTNKQIIDAFQEEVNKSTPPDLYISKAMARDMLVNIGEIKEKYLYRSATECRGHLVQAVMGKKYPTGMHCYKGSKSMEVA